MKKTFFAAPLLLFAGCATKEMASTPFYTGNDVVYTGNPEERVNLWPLFTWRKDASYDAARTAFDAETLPEDLRARASTWSCMDNDCIFLLLSDAYSHLQCGYNIISGDGGPTTTNAYRMSL